MIRRPSFISSITAQIDLPFVFDSTRFMQNESLNISDKPRSISFDDSHFSPKSEFMKHEPAFSFAPLIPHYPKNEIMEKLTADLNLIMEKWITNHSDENFSGGKMRGDRGDDIEKFVRGSIQYIGTTLGVPLVAKRGGDDKKALVVNVSHDKTIQKNHQVDVHVYLNEQFVSAIECKAYLDSCYYVRACDDFMLFKKFNYNVKHYIFTLENSIDEDTKIFTDHITNNICDGVFYMLDGKRSSVKPIYDQKHRKKINMEKLENFVDFVVGMAYGNGLSP